MIFSDLTKLCQTPGYVHAIVEINIRDNLVQIQDKIKPKDLNKMFGYKRVIRTEMNTLIGLMAQGNVDLSMPARCDIDRLVSQTDKLLEELHDVMSNPNWETILNTKDFGKEVDDVWRGEMMREPYFYASESAYNFQYRDMCIEKYEADNNWLIANKGFSIHDAKTIANAICDLMNVKCAGILNQIEMVENKPQSWLPCFEHTSEEIAFHSKIDIRRVVAFIMAFTLDDEKYKFKALNDFNAVCGAPLLKTNRGTYLLFQHYGIYEAIYDTPFYWMLSDEKYRDKAFINRGKWLYAIPCGT